MAFLSTSCDKWFDVRPSTQELREDMFDTEQGYKDALTGCYMKMKSQTLYGRQLTFGAVEYLAQHWDVQGETATITAIKNWDYEDAGAVSTFRSIYGGLYNVIIQANTILLALPETGETAIEHPHIRAIIEAEARAIRAFCHFDVLRIFGQLPNGGSVKVRLPYSEDVSRNPVAYYSYEDFTAKIENDLNIAEKLLKEHDPFVGYTIDQVNRQDSYSGYDGIMAGEDEFLYFRTIRMNYWAVKALQARFYLYTATAANGNAAKAYAAAREVINVENETASRPKKFPLTVFDNTNNYYAIPQECMLLLNNTNMADYIPSYTPPRTGDTTLTCASGSGLNSPKPSPPIPTTRSLKVFHSKNDA